PWLIISVCLAGCSPLAGLSSAGTRIAPVDLSAAAAELERGCGLAAGSLLHVTSDSDLEVWPVTQPPTYPQFACVMEAIEQAKLERRGVRIILAGEDDAQ
ncbi:hypothetical protein, partial [Brevundimonas sp.]|uniref:hypothetical protein n=1 Tax=Brevundimonas sp. TaxID=1871086 RepID=UPI002D407BD0